MKANIIKDGHINFWLSHSKKFKSTQNKYNKNGNIQAIPIIIYHRAGDKQGVDYNTDLKLFEKEMKYLHDNGFTVLTMSNLGYNQTSNYLYVRGK